ncbi:MAG TPA: DUF3299 domain-containing protein [Azospirillaceae bacterium]|nr:DUF3299 domain-containing protein [Azospirillaceae bacterium]
MSRLPLILAAALVLASPAVPAFEVQQVQVQTQPGGGEANAPGAIPRATLGWDLIADVREEQSMEKGKLRIKAVFGDKVKALEGKELTIGGFMIPLEQKEKSQHFLLSALAPSCPFCPPPGPADLVEVRTEEPVAFTYDMVTLKGTLRISADDENGLYYRLEKAAQQPAS